MRSIYDVDNRQNLTVTQENRIAALLHYFGAHPHDPFACGEYARQIGAMSAEMGTAILAWNRAGRA